MLIRRMPITRPFKAIATMKNSIEAPAAAQANTTIANEPEIAAM
jgi:hypothetical protein